MVEQLKNGQPETESSNELVVIIMGSLVDEDYAREIAGRLEKFQVSYELRIASAHKTPGHLEKLVREYDSSERKIIYIAVAGRSNALGGLLDFKTCAPVISCPVYSEKYSGADIFSSLRMPSGSAAVIAPEPEMAALHAVKIFSMNNQELAAKYLAFQRELQEKIEKADAQLREKA